MIDTVIHNLQKHIKQQGTTTDILSLLWKLECYTLLSQSSDKSHPCVRKAKLLQVVRTSETQKIYAACCQLFDDLMSLPYVAIKGAVLSQTLYHDHSIRFSADIDLLVEKIQTREIQYLLQKNGFIQGFQTKGHGIAPYTQEQKIYYSAFSHQAAPYIKQIAPTIFAHIDVNYNIMWGESESKLDTGKLLEHSELVSIFGQPIKKLNALYEFIALCLHHYKDMNSIFLLTKKNPFINRLCDIYLYLANTRIDPALLQSTSEHMNIAPYVYYCLYYAAQLFTESDLLLPYVSCFPYLENSLLLDCYGLNEKERKLWNIPLEERFFNSQLPFLFWNTLDEQERKKVSINKGML